jgi:hypothetical protein
MKSISGVMKSKNRKMKLKNRKMESVSCVMKPFTGEIEKITRVDFSLIRQKINSSNILII